MATSYLLVPKLLPGEWDVGYHGRLGYLNGESSISATGRLMERVVRSLTLYVPATLSARVALVVALDEKELLRDHSYAPLHHMFWMGVKRHRTDLELRIAFKPSRPGLVYGMVPVRRPRLCTACISSDLATTGMSFWRRDHQLHGMFWCRQHLISLFKAADPLSHQGPPSLAVDTADEIPMDASLSAGGHPNVQSFIEFQYGRIWHGRPIDMRDLCGGFFRDARSLTDQFWKHGELPQLRSRLNSAYPYAWLRHLLPDIWTSEAPFAPERISLWERQVVLALLCAERHTFKRGCGDLPLDVAGLLCSPLE